MVIDLFDREEKAISAATEWLAQSRPVSEEESRKTVESLLNEYRKLFNVTRRLVRVSDRNEGELRRLRSAAELAKATLSRYFSPNLIFAKQH